MKGEPVTPDEAIREVSKYEPCPHDAIDTNLGNGRIWARCDDCGETLKQESLDVLRRANERFIEAMVVLQETLAERKKLLKRKMKR